MKSNLKILEMFETLLFLFKTKIYFILEDAFFKIPNNLILANSRQISRMLHW